LRATSRSSIGLRARGSGSSRLSSPLAFPFVLGVPLGLDDRGLALLPGAVARWRGAM
jgi:hypothetical protein